MARIYEEVEKAMALLDRACTQKARELVYVPLRMRLADECSSLQQQIVCEESRLTRDTLYLQRQRTIIVLTALQDEGTLSVGEGKATLLELGGQLYDQKRRERKTSVSGALQGNSSNIDELFEGQPPARRKKSLPPPLQRTFGSQDLSDTLARMSLSSALDRSEEAGFKRSNLQTQLIASYEESMQLQHMLHEGRQEKLSPGDLAVRVGKYASRLMARVLLALSFMKEEQEIQKKLVVALCDKANEFAEKCANLERCKRGVVLSQEAAITFATDAIINHYDSRGSVDSTRIEARMRTIFSEFERKGDYYDNITIVPETHFKILADELKNPSDWSVDVEQCPDIKKVILAHAGFSKQVFEKIPQEKRAIILKKLNLVDKGDNMEILFAELAKIHRKGRAITLEKLKLVDEGDVKNFFNEILDIAAKVLDLAREHGLLPVSTEEMVRFFNFSDLIEKHL